MDLALEAKTIHHGAYAKLRELICSGELTQGQRLDERALAKALGVSRTPVREAVTRLVSDGLIEHRPYQGNFVRTFSVDQVAGLYDVRGALEVLAIREAVQRLTDETVGTVRSALDAACEALEADDLDAFAEADRRFHKVIAESSGNGTLILLLANLEAQIQLVRGVANQIPNLVERTTLERQQILEALESRDVDRAGELMAAHIEDVKQTTIAKLRAEEEQVSQD